MITEKLPVIVVSIPIRSLNGKYPSRSLMKQIKKEESGMIFTLSLQEFLVPLVRDNLLPEEAVCKLFLSF